MEDDKALTLASESDAGSSGGQMFPATQTSLRSLLEGQRFCKINGSGHRGAVTYCLGFEWDSLRNYGENVLGVVEYCAMALLYSRCMCGLAGLKCSLCGRLSRRVCYEMNSSLTLSLLPGCVYFQLILVWSSPT